MRKLVCLFLLTLPVALASGQENVQVVPWMRLTPSSFTVTSAAGVVYTHVTNISTGKMTWTTKDNQTWTTSTTPASRTDTIAVQYAANSSTSARTGTVTVSSNATNSPLTITIQQSGAPVQPVLAVSDTLLSVPWSARQAQLSVRNSGNGTLNWTAASNQGWAAIQSGASGKDSGKVVLAFSQDSTTKRRSAVVTITATGALGSPARVTLVQDSCEAAGTVALVTPANGGSVTPDTVRLRWRHGVPTATIWCLEALGDLGSLFVADSTLKDTAYTLRGLQRGYTYCWRVRPRNPTGWGSWSPLWVFSRDVSLPAAVTPVAPADRVLLAADTVRLAWKAAAPAVRRYWVESASDSLFTQQKVVDSTVVDTLYIRRSLQRGTTYLWHIRAGNLAGWGPFSPAWRFSIPLTGVAARQGSPASFKLHQNYPNPFNPATTIRFDLPGRLHVSLEVYNILGERVAALVDGDLDAGFHEARFNAENLPSGVYLCRIRAGANIDVKKLSLIR